jgi:hypothetical protein
VILGVIAAAGCKTIPPAPPLAIRTVAVLPFNNGSNNVDAADIMQHFTYAALKPSYLEVRDVNETNEFLEKAGIRDGGQLPALDPVKLGTDLGVQALLYGSVEDFSYTNVGFYQSRVVKLDLKLVEAATGAVLWQREGTGSSRNVVLDKKSAEKAFVVGIADQLTDKVFRSPLDEEARQATINTLSTLPGYHFSGFDGDSGHGKAAARNVVKDVIRH